MRLGPGSSASTQEALGFSLDLRTEPKKLVCLAISLIDHILSQRSSGGLTSVEQSACLSHRHDNGFLKLHLFDSSDRRKRARVHIWNSPSPANADANVHDHRYDFRSVILSGELENIRYMVDEEGEQYKVFTYSPRDSSGRYQMRRGGTACLLAGPCERYKAGASYALDRDTLHKAAPLPGAPCVTFCVQDRMHLKAQSTSYSQTHPDEADLVEAECVSVPDYLAALRWIKYEILAQSEVVLRA